MKKILIQWIDRAANFLNSRNTREKIMFIALGVAGLLTLDFLIFVQPVAKTLAGAIPELMTAQQEVAALKDDFKNKDVIEATWKKATADLALREGRFVAPNELPALLENLSKLAQSSGVKILMVKPEDISTAPGPYQRIPIKISCSAGTHELGKFLSQLESGPTFFLVKDLRIQNTPNDLRRHSIELSLEACRKGS